MIRVFAVMWMVLLLVTMGVAAVRVGAEPRDRTVTAAGAFGGQEPAAVTGLYRHHSAAYWAWRLPYANALAAGWMIGPAGRSGEWSCR